MSPHTRILACACRNLPYTVLAAPQKEERAPGCSNGRPSTLFKGERCPAHNNLVRSTAREGVFQCNAIPDALRRTGDLQHRHTFAANTAPFLLRTPPHGVGTFGCRR